MAYLDKELQNIIQESCGVLLAECIHVPLLAQLLGRIENLLGRADWLQFVGLHRFGDGFMNHFGGLIHCDGSFLRFLR